MLHGKEAQRTSARASAKLAEMVRAGLKELGFARSDFSISLEKLDPPSAHGNETGEFLFSPILESRLAPLRSIGSSGRNLPCHARSQERTCRPGRCSGSRLRRN